MPSEIGSGRQHELLFIKGLRRSEVEVLKALLKWTYQGVGAIKANSSNIALRTGMSQAAASIALKYLNFRGITRRSPNGSWYIVKAIKSEIIRVGAQIEKDEKPPSPQTTLPES